MSTAGSPPIREADLDQDDDASNALPGPSLPDVQHALDEQYTDEVREKTRRFAERRASLVRRAGRPSPKDYDRELVHDALTSVWLGARCWDPTAGSLYLRLCSIIKDRTWREIQRTRRHQHVPLDLAATDTHLGAEVEDALGLDASVGDVSHILLMGLTRRVVDALAELARNDDEVHEILRCWQHGRIESEEVIIITGLTVAAFRTARQRILRLSKHLPPDLREAAHDLLRSER